MCMTNTINKNTNNSTIHVPNNFHLTAWTKLGGRLPGNAKHDTGAGTAPQVEVCHLHTKGTWQAVSGEAQRWHMQRCT